MQEERRIIFMTTSDLFKVFNFETGNIIIERMEMDIYTDGHTIIEEDVITSLKQAGAWLCDYGNQDILQLTVIDYDSRRSANGVTTLRVMVAIE